MMRKTKRHVLVLVTTPDRATARKIAGAVLSERLAACVNIVPGVESHYWWRGKLERGKELLLLIKTTRARLAALAKLVKSRHPYDTPEIVVLGLEAGSVRYLDWLDASVNAEGRRL
jgi:periplasmic divalent cation tolerance protein